MSTWHFGNAGEDSAERRGWFTGHFMPDDDVRRSTDVEVKWGNHQAGEEREAWHDVRKAHDAAPAVRRKVPDQPLRR